MCSFSEEEKLPKLSEEKPSPVVAADDDDGERDSHKPFATLKVSFSMGGGGGGCNEKYRKQFLLKYC